MIHKKLCLRPGGGCRRRSGAETQRNVLPISWRRSSHMPQAELPLPPIQSHQTISDCSCIIDRLVSIRSCVPSLRQLLFECLHWLEQVSLFFDAHQRLVGTKPQKLGAFLLQTMLHFTPSDRRGNSRLLF